MVFVLIRKRLITIWVFIDRILIVINTDIISDNINELGVVRWIIMKERNT